MPGATTVLPKTNVGGGINDIASLLQALNPLFGSGKQTSTETTSADPNALNDSNNILQQIFASINPANTDALVGNILERARQAFGSNLINTNSAGIRSYSDTVQKQLATEAMARAVGESAGAVLQNQQKGLESATQLNAAKLRATSTKTGTQVTGASPLGKVSSVASLAALGYNQLKKKAPAEVAASQFGGTKGEDLFENETGGPFNDATGGSSLSFGSTSGGNAFVGDDTAALQQLIDSTTIPSAADGVQVAELTSDSPVAISSLDQNASTAANTASAASELGTAATSAGMTSGAALFPNDPELGNFVFPNQISGAADVGAEAAGVSEAAGLGPFGAASAAFMLATPYVNDLMDSIFGKSSGPTREQQLFADAMSKSPEAATFGHFFQPGTPDSLMQGGPEGAGDAGVNTNILNSDFWNQSSQDILGHFQNLGYSPEDAQTIHDIGQQAFQQQQTPYTPNAPENG